jgi:hypothetical protein
MVSGYVWARYNYYGRTLIVLALIVNTHFGGSFRLWVSPWVSWRWLPRGYVWARYSCTLVVFALFVNTHWRRYFFVFEYLRGCHEDGLRGDTLPLFGVVWTRSLCQVFCCVLVQNFHGVWYCSYMSIRYWVSMEMVYMIWNYVIKSVMLYLLCTIWRDMVYLLTLCASSVFMSMRLHQWEQTDWLGGVWLRGIVYYIGVFAY